ncbi:MAG: hypothetical protein KAV01_02885 [Candidatus Lokiarchaeota archaeon]|nr:hypothetical protein [Candidatus Lokiarchaeota archaeon]
MPVKTFNQELAKVYNCIHELPKEPEKYTWICSNCFELLFLIKCILISKENFYFLYENDIETIKDSLRNMSWYYG